MASPTSTAHFACVVCRIAIKSPGADAGEFTCVNCGMRYHYEPNYLRYDFDPLLYKNFKRDFLLNKVLNNNAAISYQFLKEGSISLSSREDVSRFRSYLETHARPGRLLDIGCGILPVPGYLEFSDKSRFELFGLDPIDDRTFQGVRIVGCAEFMPFADGQFDTIVFATSLDHTCSLKFAVAETFRILKTGGKVVVWMGDRSASLFAKFRNWLVTPLRNLVRGYRTDRYVVYPNLTVLYIPHGAVDPFHSYSEDPNEIIALMQRNGLALEDRQQKNQDQVFLSFVKTTPA